MIRTVFNMATEYDQRLLIWLMVEGLDGPPEGYMGTVDTVYRMDKRFRLWVKDLVVGTPIDQIDIVHQRWASQRFKRFSRDGRVDEVCGIVEGYIREYWRMRNSWVTHS